MQALTPDMGLTQTGHQDRIHRYVLMTDSFYHKLQLSHK